LIDHEAQVNRAAAAAAAGGGRGSSSASPSPALSGLCAEQAPRRRRSRAGATDPSVEFLRIPLISRPIGVAHPDSAA